jgi:RHS repeat-associated protein
MATAAQLNENSHQGFDGIKADLYLGSMQAKSNAALGMPLRLRQNRIRSRSSGKERDAETGLDYFLARYYSGAQGRFLSVDPENAGASKDDPQSWNAYSYSRNNPLKYTDPDGRRYKVCWDGGACEEMSDPDYSDYYQTYIDPIGYIAGGGIIYQKGVEGFVRLGTVKYLMSDEMWALMHGMQLAKPVVDALAIGTGVVTGGLAALDVVASGGAIESLGQIAVTSGGFANSYSYQLLKAYYKSLELIGEALSGVGAREIARGANIKEVQRLVSTYGGTASDWIKLSTRAIDPSKIQNFAQQMNTNIQIHYYLNKATGMIVELKSSIHN